MNVPSPAKAAATHQTSHLRVRAMLAVAVLVVAVLAAVVGGRNWLTEWDADVVAALASWRSEPVTTIARVLTLLGNVVVLAPAALIAWRIAAQHGVQGRYAPWLATVALGGAAIVDPLVKLAVERPRPPTQFAAISAQASGFPSGHAAQATATLLALALMVGDARPQRRFWLLLVAAVAAAIVGATRVVLGVHSPTDVVGGWALGLLCLVAATLIGRTREGAS